MSQILLLEDDEPIAEIVRLGLESARYGVDVCVNGMECLQRALGNPYKLVILDVMVPGLNGFGVCRELRNRGCTVPILMLTARDETSDRVKGLEIGADDYLVKPFEYPELLARVRALLRRDKVNRSDVLQIGDLSLNLKLRQASRAGMALVLTPREWELLEALALQEGYTLSREHIQERVWQDSAMLSNTVDVCIAQLRKKIDLPGKPKIIHTVHKAGYMLRRPMESGE